MKAVELFKAFADPTRIRICSALQGNEFSVNEIVALFGMGQSRISRHLKILTDCGILSCRRDGLWSFYSVATEGDGKRFIDAVSYLFKTPAFEDDLRHAANLLLERRKKSVHFFDNTVQEWSGARQEILGSFNLDEAIVERVKGYEQLADLGCGDGNLAYLLVKRGFSVIGVDASPGMITTARKKVGTMENQIEFRIGELEHLPLRDGECDAAIITLALHHLSVPSDGISEAGRILKKGGRLIVADFEKHSQEMMRTRHNDLWLGFSRDEFTVWLNSAGFKLISYQTINLENGINLAFIIGDKN